MRLREGVNARRADLLAHFDEEDGVEAKPPARRDDLSKRRDIDRVLTLVVDHTAPIDAVAVERDGPGGKTAAPILVETAHDVAVAVSQHGQRVRILDPPPDQKRAASRIGVIVDRHCIIERAQRRRDLGLEILVKLGPAGWILTLGRNRHATPKVGQEAALVIVGLERSDDGLATHYDLKSPSEGVTP